MAEDWRAVYDSEELEAHIVDLRAGVDKGFDQWFYEAPNPLQPLLCQGDMISLDSALVFLDEDGQPTAGDDQALWVVLGNSCDYHRGPSGVPWTPLLPLFRVSDEDAPSLNDLRAYRGQRVFYFPPQNQEDGLGYFTDFTCPVTAKSISLDNTRPDKRLSEKGWALFHACLVRYLARQDGRNDF